MEEFLTIKEAMELLGVDRSTLYRWSKAGKLLIYKKTGKSVLKREEVEKFLNEATPLHATSSSEET